MQRRDFLLGTLAFGLTPRICRGGTDIQTTLFDGDGWSLLAQHDNGITVYSKPVPSSGLLAFRGHKQLDAAVDPDVLFELIVEPELHPQVSDQLEESKVLYRGSGRVDFYQVMKDPGFMVDRRFWFNRSSILRDIQGVKGWNQRLWDPLDPELYPVALEHVQASWPDAVLVGVNHGSWELKPNDAGTELVYRTLTDPGGSVPSSMMNVLTGRTLPDNLLNFERAARERSG